MGPLYAYSLAPVLAVSVLLFGTAAFRGPRTRSLAAYCMAIAFWSGSLLLACLPDTAPLGERFVASGALIAAGYIHVAFDVSGQRDRRLVVLAYAVAAGVTLVGAVFPGSLYGPRGLGRGPLFWPAMLLAIGAAALPTWVLWRARRTAGSNERPTFTKVLAAGLLCALGGVGNAAALSSGIALPYGMVLVLASLLLLGDLIRAHEPPAERRLLERSLLYAALTAFLSAGFMLGALSLMSSAAEPLVARYRLGAFFLLGLAVLAFEPIRQQLGELIARLFFSGHARPAQLARALEAQEEKAERAERLAELGALVSAVAHEVRNPLGVLAAHVKLLEKKGVDEDTLKELDEQIGRASRFVDDLLRYGRPRALEPRAVDLVPTLELALGTARAGLGFELAAPSVAWKIEGPTRVEADQAQLEQAFVILFDNALLALAEAGTAALAIELSGDEVVRLAIEDSGPGIPEALLPKLFTPFVSGRKREGPRPGTGLGLATCRRIIERHGGSIRAGKAALGGARFEIHLPRAMRLPEGEPTA